MLNHYTSRRSLPSCRLLCRSLVLTATAWLLLCGPPIIGVAPADAADPVSYRLPDDVPPTIGCWFWREAEFQADGYRSFLDLVASHATYNWLTTSIRTPDVEVTSPEVHDQICRAADYARQKGIRLIMDLDVRLARRAFQKRYPNEMQEMLRLREVTLNNSGKGKIRVTPEPLSDHYTHRTTPYVALAGRLVRAFTYVRGPQGIEPGSVRDITGFACEVTEASPEGVAVTISGTPAMQGRQVCVMVAFTHLAADVFAPHLLDFQRAILAQYRDAHLGGACKDEWGFPPCFDGNPAKNDYWYSAELAAAYWQQTAGHDLLRDMLLMTYGERGRTGDRAGAINQFMALCRRRNTEVENDFYEAVKETFGPHAAVATHPTWWPYPDAHEFKKNGLDWWAVRRDWAQVDEVTPFSVRTALAKKWGSGIWYNMFYATDVAAYQQSLWTHAMANGRINYHPLYPRQSESGCGQEELLAGSLTRGDCRVRMLNFITRAAVDSPVAVVFGHACAMNWAGPAYDDVGMDVVNQLWQAGFYADLIPSSELASGALKVDADGALSYGQQRYTAAVFYHPEFERTQTAFVLDKIDPHRTALYQVGDWTRDFNGKPLPRYCHLPSATVTAADAVECSQQVITYLRQSGIQPQQPATTQIGWDHKTAAPPPAGQTRLLDGTHLVLAGEHDPAGDPIQTTFSLNGHKVTVDCIGVAAVRLDPQGKLEALAAGGLRHMQVENTFELTLEQPADIALWRDPHGVWHGALQGYSGPIPAQLTRLSDDWLRLNVPEPLKLP